MKKSKKENTWNRISSAIFSIPSEICFMNEIRYGMVWCGVVCGVCACERESTDPFQENRNIGQSRQRKELVQGALIKRERERRER